VSGRPAGAGIENGAAARENYSHGKPEKQIAGRDAKPTIADNTLTAT